MSSVACCPAPPTFFLDGPGGDGGGGGARCPAVAGAIVDQWLARQEEAIRKEAAEKKDGQLDIWAAIQSSKKAADAEDSAPYVHPLVRRSASSLSQKSLEICTESLGSETGSDGPLSDDDHGDYLPWPAVDGELDVDDLVPVDETEHLHRGTQEPEHLAAPPPPRRKEAAAVNYHFSVRSSAPPRLFPPPLPSLSGRDGPCLSMRPHRRDGRLVVEAVTVPSQNYLHARRLDGRLLLSLVATTFQEAYPEGEQPKARKRMAMNVAEEDEEEMEEEEEEEAGEEEEEEEVEVVDRGIVVEVKVSRPTPPQNGGGKVQRSSVVINKFVGAAVEEEQAAAAAAPSSPAAAKTAAITTTTTATAVVAAAAAASSLVTTDNRYWRYGGASSPPSPEKLFFTSKRTMNRHELLHQVRRCSEHLRPLFILEPCCIATS